MNSRSVVWPVVLALVVSNVARAEVDPGALALLGSPLLKALGAKEPAVDASGVVQAKVGAATISLHNKTADGSWVAVYPVPAGSAGLTNLASALGGTLSSPVLVLAGTASSFAPGAVPSLQPALEAVARDGAVAFQAGANLLSKVDAGPSGVLAELKAPAIGLFPVGGAVLTGTVGVAVVQQLFEGSFEAPSTDWSLNLALSTGAWAPPSSPLSASGATLSFKRVATGAATTGVTFGGELRGLSLRWGGAATPAGPTASLAITLKPNSDFELTCAIKQIPGSKTFAVDKVSFFYRRVGTTQDLGLSMSLRVKVGADEARFSATARLDTAGSLAFVGTLDRDWRNPFGLRDFTLLAGTSLDFSFNADADVGFGLTGNLRLGTDTWRTTFCVNVAPGPAVKAIGVSFEASTLTVARELELLGRLAASVPSGPKMPTVESLDQLPLPEFRNTKLVLYTPTLSCAQAAFEGKAGFGAQLAGEAEFVGRKLGRLDNRFQVNGSDGDGFSIDTVVEPFALPNDLLRFDKARLKVSAPLTAQDPSRLQTGSFVIGGGLSSGKTRLGRADVHFSKTAARFEFDTRLGPLGSVKLKAASVGPSLALLSDFTLEASAEFDAAAQKAVADAIRAMLSTATTERKQATQKAVDAITRAQERYKRATDRLFALGASVFNACKASPEQCLLKLTVDALKSDAERAVYADWLRAAIELEATKTANAVEAAANATWNEIGKALTAAATTSGAFKLTGVSAKGSLRSASVELTAAIEIAGRKATPTFAIALNSTAALGSPAERTALVEQVERSQPPPVAVPFLRGAPTTAVLTREAGTRPVLSVAVAAPTVRCPDGSLQRPEGTVYLYARRPDEAKPDPFTQEPFKPFYLGFAVLGKGGNCAPEGTVKFNQTTSKSGECRNDFDRIAALEDLGGQFVFTALYQGGPTACSSYVNDAGAPENGFRASLSNEVAIDLRPPNARADDEWFLHPQAPSDLDTLGGSAWSATAYCPPGTWVTKFRQRVEPKNASGEDDTALNAVELGCENAARSTSVTVKALEGLWGAWGAWSPACPAGQFVTGAKVRIEGKFDRSDATGANDVVLRCADGTTSLSAGNGLSWGNWSCSPMSKYTWSNGKPSCPADAEFAVCPAGTAVCGISVNEMPKQGKGDDTAMNALKLRCCAVAP